MNPSITRKAILSTVAVAVTTGLSAGAARAAYQVQQHIIPVTFDSRDSKTYEFNVDGFDDTTLGTLQGITVSGNLKSYPNPTLTWLATNNGSSAVSHKRITVDISHELRVKSTGTLLDGGTSSEASPYFDLDPGDTYDYRMDAFGFGGASAGLTDSDLGSHGDVPLQFTIDMTGQVDSPVQITGVTGRADAYLYLTLGYQYNAATAPAATPISVGSSVTGHMFAKGILWFKLAYTSGDLTIDTLGSDLESDGLNDTRLALYNSLGGLVDSNDDGSGPAFTGNDDHLSRLHFDDGELNAGTYYIALTGYGFNFTDDPTNFNADPFEAAVNSGDYQLNVNHPVPEPTTLALLGLGGAALLSRKRRGV